NLVFGTVKTRVDLTAEKLYTLSPGTKKILAKLDGPVEIRYYVTEGEKDMPLHLKAYAQRVEDLLQEYKQYSKGNVTVRKLDPKPDSDQEDSARLDGVEPQQLPSGEHLYLGIAINYADAKSALPFLSPERERLLEYDISRAITRVITPDKPVVGVMTALPMFGNPMNPMMARMGQQPQDPWVVVGELQRDFAVRQLQMDVDKIDDDIKVLVVAHPKDISDKAQYAIDQFILRGGRLVAFLDGQAIMDQSKNPQNPMMPNFNANSSLDKLLKAWGVQFDTTKVAADMNFATRFQRQGRQETAPAVLSLNPAGINKGDIVTEQLDNLLMPFAGVFTGTPAEGLKQQVLLKTTPNSQLVEGFMAQMGGDQIQKDFKASGTSYALAIRLTGKFKTAFPDGKPKDTKPDDEKKDGDKKDEPKAADSLKEGKGENSVILIGDVDMLSDNFSVQIQNFFGQKIVVPRNSNLSFVQNIVEQMSGDENLIAMRSRATLNRPFTVVQTMQAQADERFRAKIKEVEGSLQDTQKKLNELQAARKDQGQQRTILSAEQQAELQKFRTKEADAKRDLKLVRKDLRREIDSLENRLKWANIAGMPVLVTAFGIGLAIFKRNRARNRVTR
ncbi:MAG TPA: Gldg family protein, partial [Candidatus Binatia bacterium]|nr:Gldg family protein [Candidatus Binatia bacterium]